MFSDPKNNIEQFHIDPGMSVADFGAGSGFYALALSEAVGESGKVYTIDIQKDLLNHLKTETESKGITNIEIIWGDLDEPKGTTLKDQSVDRVVIANTFFQLENKDAAVEEARRVLKRNGKLLLIDWTDSFSGLGPQSGDVVKPDVARTIFESEGFVYDRDIKAGANHYGIVFKKHE